MASNADKAALTRDLSSRLRAYAKMMRLHRPIGTFLLLWPLLWALWIAAEGVPNIRILIVFLCGTVLMRSAGCVINDYADRNFDGYVSRTADRPLANGQATPREALILFFVLLIGAASLVLTQNLLTIKLAFVGAGLAIIYPFMKRYTYFPQVYLGAAFGWAVPMAFAAQTNELPRMCWLVFTAAIVWALIYDTQYAMVDRDDDLKIGVKSTAILFGDLDYKVVAGFQLLMLINLSLIGSELNFGYPYWFALIVCASLAVYQHRLIRTRAPDACFKAFLNNNWYGAIVFLGIAASYLHSSTA
ncbi:MAG: 4-hydroxybenzoate octaprenyltransferase [Gammaproteobacteria bacterium]